MTNLGKILIGVFILSIIIIIISVIGFLQINNKKSLKTQDVIVNEQTPRPKINTFKSDYIDFSELTNKGLQDEDLNIIKRQIDIYIQKTGESEPEVSLIKDSVKFISSEDILFSMKINDIQYSATAVFTYGVLRMQLFDKDNKLVFDSREYND